MKQEINKLSSAELRGDVVVEQVLGNIVLERRFFKNIVVNTGAQFLLDLLSGDTSQYNGNLSLRYGVAGSINRDAQRTDWNLYGEGTLNEGGATMRVVVDEYRTERSGNSITFHAVFTLGDFPHLPYSVGEAGLFLSNIPPTSNPETDSTQRPNAMFNRVVFDPPIVKQNDGTDMRIKFTITMYGV